MDGEEEQAINISLSIARSYRILFPGDTVLADRGFDIADSVDSYCSNLKIPAFTKGKNQLSGIEIEQTRYIANVPIHVERVIGTLDKNIQFLFVHNPLISILLKRLQHWTRLCVCHLH